MPEPKRHHYLPESYLARFSRGGTAQSLFWVYDIQRREYRTQTPHNTGLRGYYYAVELPDGSRDFGVEKGLATIDGLMAELLPRLESRAPLSDGDRTVLATFAAFQNFRGPEFEHAMNEMQTEILRMAAGVAFANEERAKIMMERFERDTGQRMNLSPTAMMEMMNRDDLPIDVHRNDTLRLMVKLAPATATRFAGMDWLFMHAPADRAFVTTDSPFVVVAPQDSPTAPALRHVGYGTPGTKKLFPLSARTCLLMFDQGSRVEHRDATEANVRWINERVAAEAYRFLIGRDEALVRSLVRRVETAEARRGFAWGGSKVNSS